jgi:hypothetical protein
MNMKMSEIARVWEEYTPEEKRESVMSRAKKLGHCVCNRKKMCPCDIFLEKDVCICAGESLDDVTTAEVTTPK